MSIVVRTQKQKVLDVLNSLEVIETNGGEDSYILVEMNEDVRKRLNDVGVTNDTINQYGDDEAICILSLAFNECYANALEGTKLVLRPNQFAVYENAYGEINFYDTYQEALADYEGAKENILENDATGEEEVYILEVKKVARLGYESWMKWQDSEQP